MFESDCPNCGNELKYSFGDDVTCSECFKTFETDCETTDDDNWYSWITKEKD